MTVVVDDAPLSLAAAFNALCNSPGLPTQYSAAPAARAPKTSAGSNASCRRKRCGLDRKRATGSRFVARVRLLVPMNFLPHDWLCSRKRNAARFATGLRLCLDTLGSRGERFD